MSTKTTIKRISLVAVAALGFGVLSVAPSFAAASTSVVTTDSTTIAYGGSKTVPTVGETITVDVLLAITAAGSAATDETSTVVATIAKPNNSVVGADSATASVVGAAAAYSGATAAANVLRYNQATAADKSGKLGTVTFTPDVPGKYILTLTPKNGGAAGVTASAGTARTIEINVGGIALTQGATNLGKATTGTQILGRPSTFIFNVPAGAAQNARYTITSTGTISTIYSGTANLGSGISAHTVTTGVTAVTGSTYASGAIYTVQTSGGVTTTKVISSDNYPAVQEQISIQLESPAVAGAVSVSVKSANALTGEVTTVATGTVTYAAAAAAASTLADATSTSIIAKGALANSAQIIDSATVTAAKTAGTQAATIYVTQKSAITTAVPNESMTVTITGPGLLGTGASHTATATGRSLLVKNTDYITVWPDNTSGEATITIVGVTSGVTLGVEKVTFFDTTPSSAAVTVNKAYVLAGTGSVGDVFTVVVKDKSNNAVTELSALTAAAVDTTTVVGGAVTCSTTYNTTKAGYLCSVVGKSATKFGKVSYKFTAAGTDVAATEVTATADVTFSFGVAKTVEVTGPASAGYGEEITLTFTAKDENGLPVADQTYEGSAATGGIFWNTTTVPAYVGTGFAPFNTGETITTISGVATKKLTTPTAGPKATASWTLAGDGIIAAGAVDKSIGKKPVTYEVALVNPALDAATAAAELAEAAAQDATDAALDATEAATLAGALAQEAVDAVADLSAQVATLISALKKQITTLTNLVIKIQKKVRA
jgi:trimeric autotransporter adhesin